jgi:hypothetical protein
MLDRLARRESEKGFAGGNVPKKRRTAFGWLVISSLHPNSASFK